jgi:hypothetical protein
MAQRRPLRSIHLPGDHHGGQRHLRLPVGDLGGCRQLHRDRDRRRGLRGLDWDSASTPFNLSFQDLGTPCAFTFLDATGVVTTSYDANAPLVLRCSDLNRNTSITTTQEVTMTVVASSGDQEIVTLTETGADTGVFTATLPSSTTGGTTSGDGTLHAPIGSTVTATYVDSSDATDICTGVATIRSAAPALGLAKTLVQPSQWHCRHLRDCALRHHRQQSRADQLVTDAGDRHLPGGLSGVPVCQRDPFGSAASQLTWNNIGPINSGGAKTISVFFQVVGCLQPGDQSCQRQCNRPEQSAGCSRPGAG